MSSSNLNWDDQPEIPINVDPSEVLFQLKRESSRATGQSLFYIQALRAFPKDKLDEYDQLMEQVESILKYHLKQVERVDRYIKNRDSK